MKKTITFFVLLFVGSQVMAGFIVEPSGHVGPTIIINEGGEFEVVEPLLSVILDFAGLELRRLKIPWEKIPPPHPDWSLDTYLLVGGNYLNAKEDTVENSYILNANLDLRFRYLFANRPYLFLAAGPGYYRMGTTKTNQVGVNGLAGIGIRLTPRFSVELGGNLHYLFDEGNTSFLQAAVGAVYRFSG